MSKGVIYGSYDVGKLMNSLGKKVFGMSQSLLCDLIMKMKMNMKNENQIKSYFAATTAAASYIPIHVSFKRGQSII